MRCQTHRRVPASKCPKCVQKLCLLVWDQNPWEITNKNASAWFSLSAKFVRSSPCTLHRMKAWTRRMEHTSTEISQSYFSSNFHSIPLLLGFLLYFRIRYPAILARAHRTTLARMLAQKGIMSGSVCSKILLPSTWTAASVVLLLETQSAKIVLLLEEHL